MTDTERIQHLEKQLAKLDDAPEARVREKIDLINDLAWLLRDTDTKRSFSLCNSAYSLSDGSVGSDQLYQEGMAYSLRTQGYLNMRSADYPTGLTQLHQALRIFESLHLFDGLSDVFYGMNCVYFYMGDYPQALEMVYKQMDAAQQIKDTQRIADANNNLAYVLIELGEQEQGLDILKRNLALAQEIKDERVECAIYIKLSYIYLFAGEYRPALENGLRGLHKSRELGNKLFEMRAHRLLAESYLQVNDKARTDSHLEKALSLSRKLGTKVFEVLTLITMGQAYREFHQFDRAMEVLNLALMIGQSIDLKLDLFRCHLLQSEMYEELGDSTQALHHYKQYHAIKELVFNENADQRLKVLQVAHETETAKKEAEIEHFRANELAREVEERTAELSNSIVKLEEEVVRRRQVEAEIQQMVELLEQRVADRSRELAALYDMTILLSDVESLADVLEPALGKIMHSADARGIAVHILSGDQRTLQLAGHYGLSEPERLENVRPSNDFVDWLKQGDAPLMFVAEPDELTILPTALLSSAYATFFGVALRVHGQAIGLLSLYRKRERPFTIENVSLLITMAEQLAIIIQNQRLQEQAHDMTLVLERQRLARELHDSVAQRIYSLHLFARAGIDAAREGDLAEVRLRLQQVESNTLSALREMRLLLYQLRPLALESQTLVAAFEERFERVERRLGMEAVVEAVPNLGLDQQEEEELYFIVTEALNNALKHAEATRVELLFAVNHDELEVIVRDNGQGFDLKEQSLGLGLENICTRTDNLGGRVVLESSIGEGTTIRITKNLAAKVS